LADLPTNKNQEIVSGKTFRLFNTVAAQLVIELTGFAFYFLHRYHAPVQRCAIKRSDGLLALRFIGHLNKGTAFGTAVFFIPYHCRKTNLAVRGEKLHQIIIDNILTEVRNKNVHNSKMKWLEIGQKQTARPCSNYGFFSTPNVKE